MSASPIANACSQTPLTTHPSNNNFLQSVAIDQQPNEASPAPPEATLELVLSPDWPNESLQYYDFELPIRSVNLLLRDRMSFNKVYLPVCKKFSTIDLNIEEKKFYDTCMGHEKVFVQSARSFNILNNFDAERTLMLVDADKRDAIIVNDQLLGALPIRLSYGRMILLMTVTFLHEIGHILTPFFNDIANKGMLKTTPEHIGTVNYGDGIVEPDCGYEMVQLLFGGFIMYGDDGNLVLYQVQDKDKSIHEEGNVIKRPIKDSAINRFINACSRGSEGFPIEELANLRSEDSLDQEQSEVKKEEIEEIANTRTRINLILTGSPRQPIKQTYLVVSIGDLRPHRVIVKGLTEKA